MTWSPERFRAATDGLQQVRERAFREGDRARSRGKSRGANPYARAAELRTVVSDEARFGWDMGWLTRDRALRGAADEGGS